MPWKWERGPEPTAVPQAAHVSGASNTGVCFDEVMALGAQSDTGSRVKSAGNSSSVGYSSQDAGKSAQEPSESGALTVSEAVALVKGEVAKLPNLVVMGEITGFRGPNARSGHCYFQLKDESCAMDVTMWRWAYQKLGFTFKDGMQVQLTGTFQIYDKRGSLSFNASSAALAGEGLLRQQVAELARRLEREGLMDEARKRQIPRFCERVAVVTSLSGAVIDDVRRTLTRRNPLVVLDEFGCMVQGEGAPASIMAALEIAAQSGPDAILLVRGGGSFEDLMTFNDEALARAVAACPVPVITGIGHEPDTSICDMVSDRRCSTPTAAAESVAPAIDEIASVVEERQARMERAMRAQLTSLRQRLDADEQAAHRVVRYVLTTQSERIEAFAARRCLQDPSVFIKDRRESLELSAERLHDAIPRSLARQGVALDNFRTRLAAVGPRLLRPYEQHVGRSAATLEALSPLRVLARGYAVIRDDEGHVVTHVSKLECGNTVELLLDGGTAQAEVRDITLREASDIHE